MLSCPMPTPKAKVLYLRGIPEDLSRKLKGIASLQGATLQGYIIQLLQAHVTELERKGHLPKGK